MNLEKALKDGLENFPNNDREVYGTPKAVAPRECVDYSGTQFLEDRAVLEQVLDVLDKTSEKYYEGQVSGSGKMEGNVENETGIGNVTTRVLDKGKNILTDLDNADEVGQDYVKWKRRVKVRQPLKSAFVKRAISISERLKRMKLIFAIQYLYLKEIPTKVLLYLPEGTKTCEAVCVVENGAKGDKA
ncbi:hypothetical protein L1887_39155 [Cichorium endivia]|nr:hypothetical protein L1887_39155 [Cichorium endivia]